MKTYDAVVIGAGIIGAAVARSLLQKPSIKKVAILEKEKGPALHTSGRNSGVAHSGFNLKPGSLKAKFCVEGNRRLRDFCKQKKLPLKEIGTLVVALTPAELPVLEELLKRGKENGVPDIQLISSNELKKREPYSTGIGALFSPTGSVVSGPHITNALIEEFRNNGGETLFIHKVTDIELKGSEFQIKTPSGFIKSAFLFNCAGLYADSLAHHLNCGTDVRIIPFRGDYYKLREEKSSLLNSMLYPVPDLKYPFLGIHWTKTIDGDVIAGPSATIAFGKESYHPLSISSLEAARMLFSRPFRKLLGSKEFRQLALHQLKVSWNKGDFVRQAQKLIPSITAADLIAFRGGNRAQLVDDSGKLVEDMVIKKEGNAVHVLNTVSPGLTCSLPFADYLASQMSL